MEDNKKRRSLLNLFDIVVILIGLVLAAVLLIPRQSGPENVAPERGTVRYTIELTGMLNGSAEQIEPGDALVDRVKKYEIGTVQSVEVYTTTRLVEDYEKGVVWNAPLSTQQSALIVVEAPCTQSDMEILVGGGFTIRVGLSVNVNGPGYYGSGTIVAVERGN